MNNFVPYFALFGNMSYHSHRAGFKADYELEKRFDLQTYYQRGGISRTNALPVAPNLFVQ